MSIRNSILAVGLTLAGVQSSAATTPLEVTVSMAPQRWLVQQIGGERLEVEALVPSGASPATYQPTDAQVTRLMKSRIYFRVGAPFESGLWFDAVRKLGRCEVVDLTQGIELLGDNPHIWLSPRLLRIQVTTIAAALGKLDPDNRASYEAEAERMDGELWRLDGRIEKRLLPYAGRSFLVFHPSWTYFAREYGLRQIAIEPEGKAPTDYQLTHLRAEAERQGVSTVFVQPQIHGRSARSLARAIGARVEILDPLVPDILANLEAVTGKLIDSFVEEQAGEP